MQKLPDPSRLVIISGLTTCPSGLFLHFCHAKHTRKSTIILVGRSIFWHCCCSWLESLGTKLSLPVSQKKQHQGNLPAPYTDGKGTRKFFIGKNLEENTGEWAETFFLADWREMHHCLCSLSTLTARPVTLGCFGSLAPASSGTWAGVWACCARAAAIHGINCPLEVLCSLSTELPGSQDTTLDWAFKEPLDSHSSARWPLQKSPELPFLRGNSPL